MIQLCVAWPLDSFSFFWLTGNRPNVSAAPRHGPHPLLFFMVVLVSVNQCFYHRDLIVCPGTKWGLEFYRLYAVMQSCNPSVCIWDYKSSADYFCWKKDFSGFLHRGEQPFSLQLSAERVYTALIGLTTASPSFSLTVKHIKPETSFMI